MSIVQALIEQVTAEVAQAGHPGRVAAIEIAVGRMSGVHVESLRFAFELLSSGTLADGAELRIQEPRAVLCCQACQARHEIDQIVLDCPDCGSRDITIRGGQDLLLQAIELADESE